MYSSLSLHLKDEIKYIIVGITDHVNENLTDDEVNELSVDMKKTNPMRI